MPISPEEAMRMQTEQLEVASHSKGSSRMISRRQSGSNSAFGSGMHTPSGMVTPGGGRHRFPSGGGGTRLV